MCLFRIVLQVAIFFLGVYLLFIFLVGSIFQITQNSQGKITLKSSLFSYNEAFPIFYVGFSMEILIFSSICSSGKLTCFILDNIFKIAITDSEIIGCSSLFKVPGIIIESSWSEADSDFYVFFSFQ